MARKGNVRVSITGDADQLKRETKKAEHSLDRLNKAGKRTFSSGAKSALGYSAALIGGAGIVGGLTAVSRAAADAEASQAKVKTMVENAGLSWDKYGGHIDRVIQKQARLTGFDDEELAESFANMLRATKDVNKAFELNAIAADIARTKGTGLAQSQSLVARVYNGAYMGLKRLGISFKPVTDAQDKLKDSTKHATRAQIEAAKKADDLASRQKAIALLQKNFGGQAAAYGKTQAGAMDRFKVAVENLEEKLGKALAPTLTNLARKAAKFVEQMESGKGAGGRFAKKMSDVARAVGDVIKKIKDVAGWLKDHPGLLKAAGAAWVAYKIVAVTQIRLAKLAMLGLFGPQQTAKMKGSAAASGRATGLAFKAAFVVGATVGLYDALAPKFNKILEDLTGQIDASDPTGGEGQRKADERAANLPRKAPPKKPKKGQLPALSPVHPQTLPKLRRGRGASLNRVRKGGPAVIKARASGEAGGAELGSLQRALAWVKANFSPLYEAMIEDAGGSNQHLHIAAPQGTIVAIGRALQAAGYSVGENPAFGGVHGVHTGGSYHYKGLAIDTNADGRTLSPSGGASGSGGSSAARSQAQAQTRARSRAKALAKKRAAAKKAYGTGQAGQRKDFRSAMRTARSIGPVDDKADLIDLRVAAGHLTEEQGLIKKIALYTNALRYLKGRDKLQAEANIRQFKQELKDLKDAAQEAPETDTANYNAANGIGPVSWLDVVNDSMSTIDAHVRAGDITEAEGRQQKIDLINRQLNDPGLRSQLTEDEILTLRGDLKELVDSAIPDLTSALKDLEAEIKRNTDFATDVLNTQNASLAKSVADLISGQIAGYGIAGRALTAGAGSVARY